MTGYTSRMIEQNQTFAEFTMSCARAFGALILMRDEPVDAAPPQRFEPSDWHEKRLAESQIKLAKLQAMAEPERRTYGYHQKDETIRRSLQRLQEIQERINRLQAMLGQVNAWEVPSSEHDGLKKFMIQQLADSIQSEWLPEFEAELEKFKQRPPLDFYQENVDQARWDIEYHTKEAREERECTEARNRWLYQLRDSLSLQGLEEKRP